MTPLPPISSDPVRHVVSREPHRPEARLRPSHGPAVRAYAHSPPHSYAGACGRRHVARTPPTPGYSYRQHSDSPGSDLGRSLCRSCTHPPSPLRISSARGARRSMPNVSKLKRASAAVLGRPRRLLSQPPRLRLAAVAVAAADGLVAAAVAAAARVVLGDHHADRGGVAEGPGLAAQGRPGRLRAPVAQAAPAGPRRRGS